MNLNTSQEREFEDRLAVLREENAELRAMNKKLEERVTKLEKLIESITETINRSED